MKAEITIGGKTHEETVVRDTVPADAVRLRVSGGVLVQREGRQRPSYCTLGVAMNSKADVSPAVKMFLKYAARMVARIEEAAKNVGVSGEIVLLLE